MGLETAIWHVFQHRLKPTKPSQQLSTAFRCFAMGPPEASRAVSVGFETAIWHFRSATSCFYWASKLLSGTFSALLKTLKTLKTLPAAFDGLSLLSMGPPEAPRAVSVGLRNCYLALPKRHKLFLLGFETAIWHVFSLKPSKASKPSQQLAPAFRCFAMGPPEAARAVSVGFETAIWHFRSATSCFYWASKLLSVGLRNCYLALPKRHKLFLLGFETAIWHVFSTP